MVGFWPSRAGSGRSLQFERGSAIRKKQTPKNFHCRVKSIVTEAQGGRWRSSQQSQLSLLDALLEQHPRTSIRPQPKRSLEISGCL
jgi:hypothetical protein